MKIKKTNLFIIVLAIGLIFIACSRQNDKNSWCIEDFYVYDSNGKILNYPNNEELSYYDNISGLESHYEKNGGDANLACYTRRGISVHSVAKIAFSEYDLSGFYGALTKWPVFGSLNESEENIENNFFEKYPDLNEAVKHTNEISGGLALFLSAQFQIDENGNIIQLELNEKGNPIENDFTKDVYQITFYIRDDNVFEWDVEHRSGFQWGH